MSDSQDIDLRYIIEKIVDSEIKAGIISYKEFNLESPLMQKDADLELPIEEKVFKRFMHGSEYNAGSMTSSSYNEFRDAIIYNRIKDATWQLQMSFNERLQLYIKRGGDLYCITEDEYKEAKQFEIKDTSMPRGKIISLSDFKKKICSPQGITVFDSACCVEG